MMQGGVEIMKKVTSENVLPLIYGLSILYLFITFFIVSSFLLQESSRLFFILKTKKISRRREHLGEMIIWRIVQNI